MEEKALRAKYLRVTTLTLFNPNILCQIVDKWPLNLGVEKTVDEIEFSLKSCALCNYVLIDWSVLLLFRKPNYIY